VARAMGHDEINIMKGGCSLAFGEERRQEDMRKVAEEFELTLGEDLRKKFEDMQQAEAEWARLKKGPMGTVLADEELTEEQMTDIEEGV
jgi:3-mercaptopyruvate sulfurtransferase SseA